MEEVLTHEPNQHIGRKISNVRRLVGISQGELGERIGMTKQAVSKIEQLEKIDDKRLQKIANALGVTVEGLKKFNDDKVIYNTVNFYENCGVKTESVNANVEALHQFSMEQAVKLFEELLKLEREKFENVKWGKNNDLKK